VSDFNFVLDSMVDGVLHLIMSASTCSQKSDNFFPSFSRFPKTKYTKSIWCCTVFYTLNYNNLESCIEDRRCAGCTVEIIE
jgi:hypothetical protein